MKDKLIIIVIAILVSINIGKSQNEKVIHFGVNIVPKQTKQYFEKPELGIGKTLFGLSIGIDVYYDLSSKIELKSGLNLSFNQIDQIDYSFIFGCDISIDGGVDRFNSWVRDDYKMYYLGIPIEGKYKLIGKENHLYTKIGVETLFKIKDETTSYLVECRMEEREIMSNPSNPLRDLIFKGKFGVGYEFRIGTINKIYIEPQIEYSITSIFKEVGIVGDLTNNVRILDIGIILGTRF